MDWHEARNGFGLINKGSVIMFVSANANRAVAFVGSLFFSAIVFAATILPASPNGFVA